MNYNSLKKSEMRVLNNKLRRKAELHKQWTIIVITLALVFVLSVTLGSVFTKASSKAENNTMKLYKSIQVDSGDSLWSIANYYFDSSYGSIDQYLKEIKTMNHIKDDLIYNGEYLVIPYYMDV